MRFKLGDKVLFLNETGHGIVVGLIHDEFYLIQDNDGFERKYKECDLVLHANEQYTYSSEQMNTKIRTTQRAKKANLTKTDKAIWQIDLHIEELLDDHRRMSNAEILNHQMEVFKKYFRKAINKKAHKVVVIHGVGEGVLRSEIRHYLNQFEYEYYDADYTQFGHGGTEIRLTLS